VIKAVSFDIGHTLVRYENPLNWKSLYGPALRRVLESCALPGGEERIQTGAAILVKYNTREYPRVTEVDSGTVFREILNAWGEPLASAEAAADAFFSYFQAGAVPYEDAEAVLHYLRATHIKIGALTDVAYGMDRGHALRDIAPILGYFDAVLTSVDVGYRKPHPAGFRRLLEALGVAPREMMYVGDEEKDIAGANDLGIVSVLVDRGGAPKSWGQDYTVRCLEGIRPLLDVSPGGHCVGGR